MDVIQILYVYNWKYSVRDITFFVLGAVIIHACTYKLVTDKKMRQKKQEHTCI